MIMNRITIVYDNMRNPEYPNLNTGWGFSAFIEWNQKNILFDTGWDGFRVLNNAEALNLPIKKIDAVFISHIHWDHSGGLPVLFHSSKIDAIYLPKWYSEHQMNELQKLCNKVQTIESFSQLKELGEGVYSTGSFKSKDGIMEHALILSEQKENHSYNRLLVGCSHPGIEDFFNSASNIGGIQEIIGGLHGFKNFEFLERVGIKKLRFGHCTQHKSLFSSAKSFQSEELFVGKKIE